MDVIQTEAAPTKQIKVGDVFIYVPSTSVYVLSNLRGDSDEYALCCINGEYAPLMREENLIDLSELIQEQVATGALLHYSQLQWNLRLERI